MDDIAYAADGGSAVPTMAKRNVFVEDGHILDDDRLVEESMPPSPKEMYYRYANLNVEKSPISIINEMMLSCGKQVHYNLISTRGKGHCLEFTYSLTYNDISVCGNGYSKKEAKKNTAIAFLKKLDYVNNTKTSTTLNTLLNPINENCEEKTVGIQPKLNYIGKLQELCMAYRWNLPKYEFYEKDLSDDTWSVICCIELYKSKGVDKSKHTAKYKSAYFMYEHIKGLSQQEITIFNHHEDQIINNCNKSIIDMKTLAKGIDFDIQMKMLSNLLKSKKTFINNLKICTSISEFNMSSVNVLKEIGKEEGFNVVYEVNIIKKSKKFEVSVKLSLTPVLTHMCSGYIIEETQEEVATDVLSYLKFLLTNLQFA